MAAPNVMAATEFEESVANPLVRAILRGASVKQASKLESVPHGPHHRRGAKRPSNLGERKPHGGGHNVC
jgi:hypothetical protein